jgi:hypothetical protein
MPTWRATLALIERKRVLAPAISRSTRIDQQESIQLPLTIRVTESGTRCVAMIGPLLLVLPAFAPDRPGFADSTETVDPGHAQLEVGVRSSFEDDGAVLTLPSLLLRVGLPCCLEARVTAPDLTLAFPKGDGSNSAGGGDMSLGLKAATSFNILSASAVPFLTIPTGARDLSSGAVDFGLGLNFQLNLLDDLALGWNVIFAAATIEDRGHVFDFGAGISLGYQFTDAFGAFIEAYIQYTDGGRAFPSGAGGLTYLITPTLQIDLSGGAGFTSDAEGPYVIAGVAALL